MALIAGRASLALAFLTCWGYGRRLQTSDGRSPRNLAGHFSNSFAGGQWPLEVSHEVKQSREDMDFKESRSEAWLMGILLLRVSLGAAFHHSLQGERFSRKNHIPASLHPRKACDFSVMQSASATERCSAIRFSDSQDVDLWASLRARQKELDEELVKRWRKAEYKSQAFVCQDWVRRLALEWPRAAIGTASGQILVADLISGEAVARKSAAHPAYVDTLASEQDMQLLHGEWDGGGLTALAFRDDIIVSAGRDGGAKIWKLVSSAKDPNREDVQEVGRLKDAGNKSSVVSRIQLAGGDSADEGSKLNIWLANLNGKVQRWDFDPSRDLTLSTAPPPDASAPQCALTLMTEAAVLDIAVLEEYGLIACANAMGGVELFSLKTGTRRGKWHPLAFDGSKGYRGERARSVAFIPVQKVDGSFAYCLVVGGSEGAMLARFLVTPDQDIVDSDSQFDAFDGAPPQVALLPSHRGACVSLTAIGKSASGLFVSGAHDGTCRLWDLDWRPEKSIPSMPPMTKNISDNGGPACLFGFTGFKPWLGSVATDGKRLVSDGRDNAVVVLDFSAASE